MSASRKRIGAWRILDCIAKKTGIEEDVYSLLDQGTAEKLISCARFLVCTANEPLSRIRTWQLTHPIPYHEGLSKDVCQRLTNSLGINEAFRQKLFQKRIDRQDVDELVIALDGSTVSTYSDNQVSARYGFNKAQDGLPTIKWLDLYASRTREPLAFALQPGNIPDVVSIDNQLQQMKALIGNRELILVFDNGFYSDSNAYELITHGYSFIGRIEYNTKWIYKHLENLRQELETSSCCCGSDGNVVGITKRVFHTFTSKKDEEGNTHTIRKICYLHFYLDLTKRTSMTTSFNVKLKELKTQIEDGIPLESMTESAQKEAKAYFEISYSNGSAKVSYKKDAIVEAKKDFGLFCLISFGKSDILTTTEKTHREYICREHIEDHFRAEKNTIDGDHVRSWYGENYLGKVTIQFVALVYEERLWNEVENIKLKLREEITEPIKIEKEKVITGKKQKLLTWLSGMSSVELLGWFDAIEETEVSTQIKTMRWSTEVLERDKMFLERLGVNIS